MNYVPSRILSAIALTLTVAAAAPRPPVAAEPAPGDDVADEQPLLVDEGTSPTRGNRVMLILNTPITEAILSTLSSYGKVHGWIDRYRLVAITPSRSLRIAVRALPFVQAVEPDRPRYLTDVGTWDRDMIDVTDVQETGVVGDPDPREVSETGAGVHLAVIDTGLISNWRDFLIEGRVDTPLARAFLGGGAALDAGGLDNEFNVSNPTDKWEGDTHSHGTAVASHIIGFKIRGLVVDGVAPGARVIPLKVFPNGEANTFDSRIIAAIAYVTDLVERGVIGPAVINLSLGAQAPVSFERMAIDDAILVGVVVVASAGNRGESGMSWPGAYPEVISAGAVGWTRQFQPGAPGAPNLAFWWTQDVDFDPDHGHTGEESEAFVTSFSSRALAARGQELDVVAPGQDTVAPGSHGPNAGYFFWSGTSFSAPLTAGVAALIREKNPALRQAEIEAILKSTALPMPRSGSRSDILSVFGDVQTISWDEDCSGLVCDPVGAGLLQADDALAATQRPDR